MTCSTPSAATAVRSQEVEGTEITPSIIDKAYRRKEGLLGYQHRWTHSGTHQSTMSFPDVFLPGEHSTAYHTTSKYVSMQVQVEKVEKLY
jgi:hypothetical protein